MDSVHVQTGFTSVAHQARVTNDFLTGSHIAGLPGGQALARKKTGR
jgi:hypothetical protein